MLIERRALEVSRLCVAPGDQVSAVATHVFIDATGRVAGTDGVCFLRTHGIPTIDPDLFTSELRGSEDAPEAVALPAEAVEDFLRVWKGPHVVIRREGASAIIASADGETSRQFEAASGTLEAPLFDSLLTSRQNAAREPIDVTLSLDVLLKLTRALKALGAVSVTLSVLSSLDPIRLAADADGKAIEGVVMPIAMPARTE